MEDTKQMKSKIKTKINAINEKLNNIADEKYFDDRNQIFLIINNLLETVENCDDKYLLKPTTDNIVSLLANLETNINAKQYSVNQTYLYDIIKLISYLNNANGKQNLQGYQSAVNKNISLLEKDVEGARARLEELQTKINQETEKFNKNSTEINSTITQNKTDYEKQLKELSSKYDNFIKDYENKQIKFQEGVIEKQNTHLSENAHQLLELKKEITDTQTNFNAELSKSITEFNTDKQKKLTELSDSVENMKTETKEKIDKLFASATEEIGYVAGATFSNRYKEYSDKARKESLVWYISTIVSMVALIGLSIWWFVFTKYSNTDYVALIARVCATIGVAAVARYCSIQASKSKVIETKLRKTQLEMATFDAFVASLEKGDRDKLKIELTQKLINQKDWLIHDKDEVEIIKDFEKIIKKFGYSVEINKEGNDKKEIR